MAKITMTNEQIEAAMVGGLPGLTSEKVNMDTASKLLRIHDALKPLYENYTKLKNDLVQEYGKPKKKGAQPSIEYGDPRWAEFEPPYRELREVKVELEVETITRDDLWRRNPVDGERLEIDVVSGYLIGLGPLYREKAETPSPGKD